MSGFVALLGKEATEIRRTWRIWVIPGMVILFAITSPVVALVTPALVGSIAGSQPGVVIELPPPTATDAYAQFLKSLSQLVVIAVVVASAGAISAERSSGTAVFTLTKPASRGAFVLAKLTSQGLLLIASTAAGTMACVAVTVALFGPAPAAPFAGAVLLWLVYALLLLTLMTLFSATFEARGAAAGAGLAFYFLTLILSLWEDPVRYTFVGLLGAASDSLLGRPVTAAWPVVTSLAFGALSAAAAVKVFERKEL